MNSAMPSTKLDSKNLVTRIDVANLKYHLEIMPVGHNGTFPRIADKEIAFGASDLQSTLSTFTASKSLFTALKEDVLRNRFKIEAVGQEVRVHGHDLDFAVLPVELREFLQNRQFREDHEVFGDYNALIGIHGGGKLGIPGINPFYEESGEWIGGTLAKLEISEA